MRVIVALAVAGLLAGEARATDQFDLVCKGEMKDRPARPGKPYANRYRVDLAKQEWCTDDCSVVRHLTDVTSSRLTFENEDRALPRKVHFQWVDRASGAWTHLVDDGIWFEVDGTCDPAPFSGFGPPAKF